jgi:hypothetical protein
MALSPFAMLLEAPRQWLLACKLADIASSCAILAGSDLMPVN